MINNDLGYIYEMGEIHLEGFWYVTHTAFLRLYALKQKEKFADHMSVIKDIMKGYSFIYFERRQKSFSESRMR